MKKLIELIIMLAAGIAICSAGMYMGYMIYSPGEEAAPLSKPQSGAEEVISTEDRITSATKIIYQYYNTTDGTTESIEELPPYYLIGLDRTDLALLYSDWQINQFSPYKVTMQKSIAGVSGGDAAGSEDYVIRSYNGYVAVFFKQEQDVPLEVTDTPAAALTPQDRAALNAGIEVHGKTELIRCLENYES